MTEAPKPKPKMSPERQAELNKKVLAICAAFFGLMAVVFGAYAYNQHEDYEVRTSPPNGKTTAAVVDEVQEGEYCSSSGKSTNCSPEYTLAYKVDGDRHTTAIRKHLHSGDTVHAFQGSDGKWYVTEDPGFGNSKVAWMIWSVGGLASLIAAGLCVRSWRKIDPPHAASTQEASS